jgi:hypothetical protein
MFDELVCVMFLLLLAEEYRQIGLAGPAGLIACF